MCLRTDRYFFNSQRLVLLLDCLIHFSQQLFVHQAIEIPTSCLSYFFALLAPLLLLPKYPCIHAYTYRQVYAASRFFPSCKSQLLRLLDLNVADWLKKEEDGGEEKDFSLLLMWPNGSKMADWDSYHIQNEGKMCLNACVPCFFPSLSHFLRSFSPFAPFIFSTAAL